MTATFAAAFGRCVTRLGLTVAVAESMTAGELATTIVEIDGSGEWFHGGVVAYASSVKHDLLGVAPGPVISAAAALEMASGVSDLLKADIGIATTGCAGPTTMEGQPVGTLVIGVDVRSRQFSESLCVEGRSPSQRRDAAVEAALSRVTALLLRGDVA